MRVFPISNWTELDIWQYINNENLELPQFIMLILEKYILKNNLLVPVTEFTQPCSSSIVEEKELGLEQLEYYLYLSCT